MAEPSAGGAVTCPDCGGPVRPGRERLCPRCGFPLMFLRESADTGGAGPARVPGERDEATSVLRLRTPDRGTRVGGTSIDEVGPLADGQVVCRRCGLRNPPERIRCQRCGLELRAVPQLAPPPPVVPAPPPPSARRWWPLALAAVVAVVLIGGAALLAAIEPDFTGSPDDGTAPAAAELVQVDRTTVRASASSTLDDPRFKVAYLTDGDSQTAWQSDGRRQGGRNVGVRLTFRFASAVPLARITVVNGYGRSPEDYQNNERLAKVRVSAGEWSGEWPLTDTVTPQSLDIAAGSVDELTIEVAQTYPGARFPDLAVSEVTFYQQRG